MIKNIKESQSFINLTAEINDIEEYINENKINVVPIPKNKKGPIGKNWNKIQYDLTTLKESDGNYGMLIGYNHSLNGESIAVIDSYYFANVFCSFQYSPEGFQLNLNGAD